jgi:hypothetical protein
MAELDLENRKLCPDGACIGVIGEFGRCKVCGLAYDGADDGAFKGEYPAEPEPEAASAASDEDSAFDDDRQLCPDGACIGVIGSDGKCKVCGRRAGS